MIAFTGIASLAAQQKNSDHFSFSAITAQRGKSEHKYMDDSGARVREVTRNQCVDAKIFFTSGPTARYAIQCFFVARDEKSKNIFVYDAQSKDVEGKGNYIFQAPSLTGTVNRSRFLFVDGTTMTGESVTGTLYFSSSVAGAKIYGWLVRVISDGKVLKVETNQPALKSLVEKNLAIFDAAFANK